MPSVSLWVTSGIMQLAMILVYFASNAWNTMLSVTAVMILPPYLACTAYLWKICATKQYPAGMPVKAGMAYFCGIAGSLYALWMIYAAGFTYLLMAFVFLTLGIPVYVWARKNAAQDTADPLEKKQPIFTKCELVGAVCIVLVAVGALIAFVTGKIKL